MEEKNKFIAEAIEILGTLLFFLGGQYSLLIDSEDGTLKIRATHDLDPEEALKGLVLSVNEVNANSQISVGTIKYTDDEMDVEIVNKEVFPSMDKALEYLLYKKSE